MHKVERAVIMAAGIGKRMQPVTLNTPKPLISVNGERMIESIIKGLNYNGINEIYIVVGYLKEQFYYLENKYSGIHIIENLYYQKYNNISSLYAARDHLCNSIVLDGDQIIYNKDILSPTFERSGYNAVWVEEETSEWLMQAEAGVVVSCSRTGGDEGWQLFSISRWSAEDGERLKKHLEIEFENKNNTEIYWDDIVMFCYPQEYDLGIFPMKNGDVVEIDNIRELAAIDNSYKKYLYN